MYFRRELLHFALSIPEHRITVQLLWSLYSLGLNFGSALRPLLQALRGATGFSELSRVKIEETATHSIAGLVGLVRMRFSTTVAACHSIPPFIRPMIVHFV